MRCLIWICTVCLCPIKNTLGLNGLVSRGPETRYEASWAYHLVCLGEERVAKDNLFIWLWVQFRGIIVKLKELKSMRQFTILVFFLKKYIFFVIWLGARKLQERFRARKIIVYFMFIRLESEFASMP